MSTPPNTPNNIEDQLALYFDNQDTPQVVQAIQSWLEEDPANAQTFAEYGYIERMIFCAQKKEDATAIFSLLAEMEENASAQIVSLDPVSPSNARHSRKIESNAPLAHDLHAACKYLIRHALTPKRIAIMATAAALVLGAILTIVLLGNTESSPGVAPRPEVADVPDALIDKPVTIVATLTAEHDAVWERRPGQDLYAGQRLTLTAGFAEITTNHGAIAILEAPATFQMIDSDNALRLYDGKLVGICETQSSKGFLVRTPHMDVIDLGTRFGVDAMQANATKVHVFEGEVAASSSTLEEGQLPSTIVRGGEAMTVTSSGEQASTSAIAMGFVGAEEFAALRDTSNSASARWQAKTYELQRDSNMLGLFLADAIGSGQDANALANLAASPGKAVSISDARFVKGANLVDEGLRIEGEGDTFSFEVDGPLNEVTLLAWAKLDPDNGMERRAMMASDGQETIGMLHWNLYRKDTTIYSQVGRLRTHVGDVITPWPTAKALFPNGQVPAGWHLYAISFDGRTGELRQYLDGELLAQDQKFDSGPIVLGTLRVGAWLINGNISRVLNGTIGMIGVADECWDESRLSELHQLLDQAQSERPKRNASPDF